VVPTDFVVVRESVAEFDSTRELDRDRDQVKLFSLEELLVRVGG
jgi:hypothetical protein